MSDHAQALKDAQHRLQTKIFGEFFLFCRGLKAAVVDFCEGGSEDPLTLESGIRHSVKNLSEANCVSSLIAGSGIDNAEDYGDFIHSTMHKPVLDIDMPCLLMDSTTPGHHHLIIDKPMPWRDYMKLLDVLAEVGIIEDGFRFASISRGASWVRTPWTKKEK